MFWLESDAYFNVEGFLIKALFDSKLECILHITELLTLVDEQHVRLCDPFQLFLIASIRFGHAQPGKELHSVKIQGLEPVHARLLPQGRPEEGFSHSRRPLDDDILRFFDPEAVCEPQHHGFIEIS